MEESRYPKANPPDRFRAAEGTPSHVPPQTRQLSVSAILQICFKKIKTWDENRRQANFTLNTLKNS